MGGAGQTGMTRTGKVEGQVFGTKVTVVISEPRTVETVFARIPRLTDLPCPEKNRREKLHQ